MIEKGKLFGLIVSVFLFVQPLSAQGAESARQNQTQRYQNIKNISELASFRFAIIDEQVFDVYFQNFGHVRFVPALDELHNTIVIFFADKSGKVVFRTDKIESNARKNNSELHKGQSQIEHTLVATYFHDANGDGFQDILLVCRVGAFKVGDVLFQSSDGFYSNPKVAEAINNFSMNKNVATIVSFVDGKQSKEFLYTSKTLEELTSKGFFVLSEHSFWTEFESFGRARVVPGIYAMGGLRTLMLYILDSSGNISARIDGMKEYDDCVNLMGISFRDVDGDGLRDIIVLARYRTCNEQGFSPAKTDFHIEFQKGYWFERDFAFENEFFLENPSTLYDVILNAQKYFRSRANKS